MAVCVPPAFEIGFFEFSAIPCDPGLGCDIFHPLLLSVARLEISECHIPSFMSFTFFLL